MNAKEKLELSEQLLEVIRCGTLPRKQHARTCELSRRILRLCKEAYVIAPKNYVKRRNDLITRARYHLTLHESKSEESTVRLKQNLDKPCKECPFRKKSAPGWLGSSTPEGFMATTLSDVEMPCHLTVDYTARS